MMMSRPKQKQESQKMVQPEVFNADDEALERARLFLEDQKKQDEEEENQKLLQEQERQSQIESEQKALYFPKIDSSQKLDDYRDIQQDYFSESNRQTLLKKQEQQEQINYQFYEQPQSLVESVIKQSQ